MPAIHAQIRTRLDTVSYGPIRCSEYPYHETASSTDQEHSSAAILARSREPVQHIMFRPLHLSLREFHEQRLDHGRHDVARGDGVDTDVILTPLHG
jgi:hypothetical protein